MIRARLHATSPSFVMARFVWLKGGAVDVLIPLIGIVCILLLIYYTYILMWGDGR